MNEQTPAPQEIIIVRRQGGDGDGGHHGGAWKIAYADFVTAMMAFFLVMWLVNSANEVTKSRVASYFNPIKMTDAAANARGLKNPTDKKATEQKIEDAAANDHKEGREEKEGSKSGIEDRLLEDPFSTLDKIISKASIQLKTKQDVIDSSATGDPFDPKAWEAMRNGKLDPGVTVETQSKRQASMRSSGQTESDQGVKDALNRAPLENLNEDGKTTSVPTSKIPSQTEVKHDSETLQLQETLKELIEKHKSELDITADVRRTDEGLLIKLGDQSGTGMFAIGSAEPNAGLIEIVGVIGKLLSQQTGGVVVRGHTDGRKYRKGRRDNWQLSTARAHMASYMLMRGGLDEARIKSIEGHGAASPLLPSDPVADANRRVEFLLQSGVKRSD